MKYDYPIITCIDDVLPAVKDREEFIIAERPGHTVINYAVNFLDTFPKIIGDDVDEETKKLGALRRECRGIKFDDKGRIICRPLHKFFNLNEKEETQTGSVDIKVPHSILEKLDGSFIAPYIANNKLIYGTKMGETHITDMVLEFIKDKPKYNEFCLRLIDAGYTPVFEYTSPLNRIVIPYDETNLTLIAIRHMVSGRYYSYEEMKEVCRKYSIPLVTHLDGSIENMEQFVKQTNELLGQEGYVIRFDSGYMLKLKASDYVRKHKVKDRISLEKNVVEVIFSEKLDDVIADLPEEDAAKVKKYAESVTHSALSLSKTLSDIVNRAREEVQNDRKRFALEIIPQHKQYSSLLFSVWTGQDPYEAIKAHVLKNCGTQTKIDNMRNILGDLRWNDVYISNIED